MTFVLITGSIMAISIFLIYRLCRYFGIEMKWTSLVLCAVMAFVVNGMAITMSPFLDRGHYLRLGILVVTAAAVVTLFNERMLRREEALAGHHCAVLPTAELPVEEDSPVEDTILQARRQDSPTVAEESAKETVTPTDNTTEKTDVPVAAISATAKPQENNEAEKAVAEARLAAQAIADKKAKQDAEKAQKEAEAAAEAEAKAKKAAQERAAQKKREEAARKKAEAVAKKQAAAKAKAEAAEKARQEAAAKKAQQEKELAEKQKVHEQKLKQELSSMDSLDAILDFAYETKDTQPKDAIFAYREAITRYGDDDYTPFLIIELGNLYKEQANYRGAIATYKQALDMPIIARNDTMRQEFTKNIHYLGTVQDILAKHAALSTPFPQIPGNIMQEIETEFQAHSDSAK
ncbi:MAG: hypothetical protein K6F95_09955 [Selenomonas sp.]|uniref:tetratricopeptide repeat protein n=1 Tax=Selenomonas sp. TaxID=2053611 RepID=UPI0025E3BF63|nr:hypothetical protein [Selenomonas sp.]MCR5758212.1 hypothetical protein [Selenomonas sp.]